MPCERSKTTVNWVLSKDFIEKIKLSLKNDLVEIAGKILFEDDICNKPVCNKRSSNFKINKGDKDSVSTPHGIINFHTHPKRCYEDSDCIYGWPSGEDMAQCISFAKRGNLIHIVFTLEGAYIIKVNSVINAKHVKKMEDIFKLTHTFRSPNPSKQNRLFLDTIKVINLSPKKTPIQNWLELVNNISLKKLYTLYNNHYDKKLDIPNDNTKIFTVELLKMGKTVKFNTNYISEKCHKESFQSYPA